MKLAGETSNGSGFCWLQVYMCSCLHSLDMLDLLLVFIWKVYTLHCGFCRLGRLQAVESIGSRPRDSWYKPKQTNTSLASLFIFYPEFIRLWVEFFGFWCFCILERLERCSTEAPKHIPKRRRDAMRAAKPAKRSVWQVRFKSWIKAGGALVFLRSTMPGTQKRPPQFLEACRISMARWTARRDISRDDGTNENMMRHNVNMILHDAAKVFSSNRSSEGWLKTNYWSWYWDTRGGSVFSGGMPQSGPQKSPIFKVSRYVSDRCNRQLLMLRYSYSMTVQMPSNGKVFESGRLDGCMLHNFCTNWSPLTFCPILSFRCSWPTQLKLILSKAWE